MVAGRGRVCVQYDPQTIACLRFQGAFPEWISLPSPWIHHAVVLNALCGIDADRQLWCQGAGDWLGLGLGSPSSQAPVLVDGQRSWIALESGSDMFCAITDEGHAACWGPDPEILRESTGVHLRGMELR